MQIQKSVIAPPLMDSLWDRAAEGDVHQIMPSILLGKKEKKEVFEFY